MDEWSAWRKQKQLDWGIGEELQRMFAFLHPANRKKAMHEISQYLLKSNKQRVSSQQNSSGAAYPPRKKHPLEGIKTAKFHYTTKRGDDFEVHHLIVTKRGAGYVRGYFPWKDSSEQRTFSKTGMDAFSEDKNKASKRKMLLGFKRHMKTKATPDKAEVGIYGHAAKVATVHDEGKTENGIKYPSRNLIRYNPEDAPAIDRILQRYVIGQALKKQSTN